MSSLSITILRLRMASAGAVMTSALVPGSAQMITLSVRAAPAGRLPRPGPRCADLLAQPRGEILGVRVTQVDDLGVAAVLERRVEVRDECAQSAGAPPGRR
jgi:hypothetical protein